MFITAVIDRIENGNAVLLSGDIGVEISIPVKLMEGIYKEGEELTITLDNANHMDKVLCHSTAGKEVDHEE